MVRSPEATGQGPDRKGIVGVERNQAGNDSDGRTSARPSRAL